LPRLIPYDEAVERIRAERTDGGDGCVVCALRDGRAGPRFEIARGAATTTLVSRYARRFGHVLVLLDAHVTRLSDVPEGVWLEACAHAWRAARVLERELGALRCYTGSFGSSKGTELPLSSSHVHLHVIPIYDEDDRPSQVLTSANGLVVADDAEWRALHARLVAAWNAAE
jgi:diadenosine tetraphosphate (Ap4A) HIT family hydrolase